VALEVALEAAQEVIQEVVPEVAIASGSGLRRELGTRKRKRTAKAVVLARYLKSSGRKRQKR
jgi:hypothetical protein